MKTLIGVKLSGDVTPINDMSMRKIDLATMATNELYLNEHTRRVNGLCVVNCYQRHNLMSSLSTMPIHFHTTVDDTVHWPRPNYEKDCVSNVRGFQYCCVKSWKVNPEGSRKLHNLTKCT